MSKPKIYEQHDATFNQVAAYVLMKGGERIGTLAFKFPKDGVGRLYCYLHIIGLEMARGYAGGYGYDKKSASVASAASAITPTDGEYMDEIRKNDLNQFRELLNDGFSNIGGKDWQDVFRSLNINVFQAV